MKKFNKTMAGVTLLEIMLVLAIAAMIIVMSVRYYQSASISQQSNMALEEIQAITAAADNLAMGSSSYSGVTTSSLSGVVGSNNMKTPTQGSVTVTQKSTTSYTVSMPLNTTICNSVVPKLSATTKIINAATKPQCSGTGTLTYTYDSTK